MRQTDKPELKTHNWTAPKEPAKGGGKDHKLLTSGKEGQKMLTNGGKGKKDAKKDKTEKPKMLTSG
jgi:hypothetical protein